MIRRRTLVVAGLFAPVVARAQSAWAPNRALRFVVPYVAGGSTDIAARIIAERMTESLGQAVVVENRGGSGGNIGGDLVAKAPADGHTLLMGTTGLLTTNQHIYAAMPFDPVRDLAPVSMAYTSDMVIVVTNRLPVRTLADFVALAKQRPGAFSFGSSGHGASTHTAAELFKIQAGIDVVHVPYRGSGAAMNDLVAGNIEMMLVQIAATTGNIGAGQIRALAVTGPQRHPLLPQIETVTEAGYPGATATSWGCVMATGGTPPAAIARLNQAVRAAVADPAAQTRMANAGVDGASSSVEELTGFLRSETEKWGRVVREAHIRVE
ncbi:MAG TPA: tripartite tricarboxylate transporter substrate binding protein [Roseomonas sp.]|jgi:tripartite-type tricarboxylate transporter receptor subunit TctC